MGAFLQQWPPLLVAFTGIESGCSRSAYTSWAGSNAICLPFIEGCVFAVKTLSCLSKTCLDAISTCPLFGKVFERQLTHKTYFHLLSPNHFICPSVAMQIVHWVGKVCVYVCGCACVYEHVLFTSCFALWSNMSSVNTLFSACVKIQLSSQWSSQLGSQTGSLQAPPEGKVCCLCAHKHCHSVKLPSSSKGYRVIRYTGEINSSAPEKPHTQLPHLLVHITHSLPLWWGIMQATLTPTVCERSCR